MSHPKQSASILSSILFGRAAPHPKGRVIKFNEQLPDIDLSTGSLKERVIAAIGRSSHPLTAKDVSDRIGAAHPRTYAKLKSLVEEGVLQEVKLNGCVTEYMLVTDV